ncbi:MAG: hypothetical protein MUP45_00695 [Candidatus Marinimicrobia bacterium]|nr:hypothetical protein [Candidatus Neomarinimicrobiota bacterium]
MNKDFNPLLLHQPTDIHPRSWIGLKGPGIKTIFNNLEGEIFENQGWCREKLSKEIANQLNCAHTTIKWGLQGKREFYPIPIVLELLKFSKDKKRVLKKLKKNIKYLKVNSASAKPVRAIYDLSEDLAKILGAFMADGSLCVQVVIAASRLEDLENTKRKLAKLKIHYSIGNSPSRNQYYISIQVNKNNFKLLESTILFCKLSTQTHYNVELSDEYKDSVEAFIGWIKKKFDINPNSFKKKRNAWRVTFSNKILVRYLMCFFEVKPGPKAYYAFEPNVIKKSNLKIRKAFAKGVLMFDGCVTKRRNIVWSTKSQKLHNSIKEIWQKDNIKFGERTDNRGDKILFTTAKNRRKKLLDYFEDDTQKWKLFNWLSGDLKQTPTLKESSFLSTENILKVLQKIKRCDADFLKNHFGCTHFTIRSHLKILKRQGKINLSNHPHSINDYISQNTRVFLKNELHQLLFSKIRMRFKKDKNFAEFLRIHKATLSAWRVKKNRIPIYILREICKALDFDFSRVSKNIAKTDREVAEII